MSCSGCTKRQRALAGVTKRPGQTRPTAAQLAKRVAVVTQHLGRDVRRSLLTSRRGK